MLIATRKMPKLDGEEDFRDSPHCCLSSSPAAFGKHFCFFPLGGGGARLPGGWKKAGTPHPTQGQVPVTASFPYPPEKHLGPAVDLEKMPMTSKAGVLGPTLPGAFWVGCFLLPLLGRELGCWITYWPGSPLPIPFLGSAEEEAWVHTSCFPCLLCHPVVWDELELLPQKTVISEGRGQ